MAARKKTRRRKVDRNTTASRQILMMVHSTGITSPLVMDFGDPPLREAFRIWWHPYDMGPDFDAMTGRSDRSIARGDTIRRRRLDPGYYRRISRSMKAAGMRVGRDSKKFGRLPVKVAITLTYPLREHRTKVVTIDRRYPGEIFALTHDFYRELYAEDERKGGKAGPAKGAVTLLNRGCGPLVWGHDLGDLVFECCIYRRLPKIRAEAYGDAEGEFTFSIGS